MFELCSLHFLTSSEVFLELLITTRCRTNDILSFELPLLFVYSLSLTSSTVSSDTVSTVSSTTGFSVSTAGASTTSVGVSSTFASTVSVASAGVSTVSTTSSTGVSSCARFSFTTISLVSILAPTFSLVLADLPTLSLR